MNALKNNKVLSWLLLLLIIANVFTMAMFWLNKKEKAEALKSPDKFLIEQLQLTKEQQAQLNELIIEHRQQVNQLRKGVKSAKDNLFELVKDPSATDSMKMTAASAASVFTEQIDIATVNHFQKIRKLCNPQQQKKFDEILLDLTRMMGPRRPPGGPGGPPGDHDDQRPPPSQF
jgi:periplasmic protein CpxP/Spy